MTANNWWEDAGQVARKFRDLGYKMHGERLAVLRPPVETMSKGGIVIPDTAQEVQTFGTIVAIGDQVSFEIQPGDQVCVGKWTPKTVAPNFPDGKGDIVKVSLAIIHQLDVLVSWPGEGDWSDLAVEHVITLDGPSFEEDLD